MNDAGVAETHISRVFFSGDRAYKLLKPVTTGFLDFSDRSTRLEAARRELELNRRLAPDVYLGLADIHEDGELVDHMVVMARMASEHRLSSLLAAYRDDTGAGDATRACLTAVARSVAGLHLAGPALSTRDVGTVSRDDVAVNWSDNLEVISNHVGTIIDAEEYDEVRRLATDYLHACPELFARRIEQGWIRDGHGDLRAEDIFCLEDGPRILDCLAFSDELRRGDVLADIGFLAMDVLHLAGPDLARDLMTAYQEFTAEAHPSSLIHHYIAYRAHVRVKVACLRYVQGDGSQAAEARELHHLAVEQLRIGRLSVVMVGGGPGTGKSSVARALSRDLGLALVSSDEIRKELAGLDPRDDASAAPDEGIYDPAMSERVYREMARQADVLLSQGERVVLDASWSAGSHRELVRAVAGEHRARLVEIECRVDRDVAKRRVAARQGDPSDATAEIVDHLADSADRWPQAITLDTAGSVEAMTAGALAMAAPNR